MITCYFGVPGVGKTTLLTKKAIKEIKLINRDKGRYEAVYTNFKCKGAYKIDFNDLKTFKICNSLIILDEITMDADNRDFKNFPDAIRDFFILHRHLGNDIIYATQSYEAVDKKIRILTQDLWYMTCSVVPLFSLFTCAKRIYRTIDINDHTSELIMGYRFCNFIESIFARNFTFVFRPLYYKYFDSFEHGTLEDRPYYSGYLWEDSTTSLPEPDIISFSDVLDLSDDVSSF